MRHQRGLTIFHRTTSREKLHDANTIKGQAPSPAATVGGDALDLDISVLESGDGSATVINLTDDGCKPICNGSCATNAA
ncbi:FxLD family lanthipeptide [Streptomyces sp. NPDC094143]|uniref:FxLD family lanthipeptide n=1 Tax=Streptomyces sp. NPDC094143 TaxID=3155310 RepID=UPI003325A2DB